MLSQNDTTDGWRTLSVNNWSVNGPAAGLGRDHRLAPQALTYPGTQLTP